MCDLKLTKIKNHFEENALSNVSATLVKELDRLGNNIEKGNSIAIAVGSRGIDNLQLTVKIVVDFVRKNGAEPFIVPAMGSHGGATSEGQAQVLEGYGISENLVGAPIKSSMEVVEITNRQLQNKIFMDRYAYESDGIILINKIKPHTDFRNKYESGLVKMSVIGLGKEHGAKEIHQFGVYGLKELLSESAKLIFESGKIIGGIAMIENAYDKTMEIKAIPSDQILSEEPELLKLARANRPNFPVDQFDVLWIDQMGKNISGVGIDTNIIGRLKIYGQQELTSPSIKSIVVADLTDESHGNATGVGLADIIVNRLYQKIDFGITYKNISTSSFLERGKIPFVAENDGKAMQLAMRNCGNRHLGHERIIRIKDTLNLDELYVSQPIVEEIEVRAHIEVMERNLSMFDSDGSIFSF